MGYSSLGLLGRSPVGGKLSRRSCSRSPGLLMGSDGLGQPVQAVQVVVRGEVLLAGGTNGSCLEASPEHACRGEEAVRASSGQPGRASPAAASSVPPASGRPRSAHLARTGASPGCCWGSRPGSPPRSWMARSCPGERGSPRFWGGPGRGAGKELGAASRSSAGGGSATHNPHAIEGHPVVEVLQHVVPPLVRLRVGEVWESRRAWPHLQEGGSAGQSHATPVPVPSTPLFSRAAPACSSPSCSCCPTAP